MKLPIVDGKEIVPVRLIPLIANAWLGQETISGILANRVRVSGWPYPSEQETFVVNVYDEKTNCTELSTVTRADLIGPKHHDNGVHAYFLNDDSIPVKMWSSEWEEIYQEIKVIEPMLRKVEGKNGVRDSLKSAWKLKVTKILPPGVFLWLDDFELLWKDHISTFSRRYKHPPDFLMINYDAYVRPEYRELVWEGFEHLRQPEKTSLLLTEEASQVESPTEFERVEAYFSLNGASSVGDKVLWLRTNTRLTNQKIGDLLNIGTDDPRSKSRKVKVQAIYKEECMKHGMWPQKIITPPEV